MAIHDRSRKLPPINSTCPNDKHALRAIVAKACFAKHPDEFDLDTFVTALEIEAVLEKNTVTDYEPVLLKMVRFPH